MCEAPVPKRMVEGIGEFMKGNEPVPMRMPVIAAQCECGAWFVRTRGGRWVPAELEAA